MTKHRTLAEAYAANAADCAQHGHSWIAEQSMTVVHKNDPLWIGTVLSVTREGVRVHRKITDAWGTVTGTIEATFQPNELRIIEEDTTHA